MLSILKHQFKSYQPKFVFIKHSVKDTEDGNNINPHWHWMQSSSNRFTRYLHEALIM